MARAAFRRRAYLGSSGDANNDRDARGGDRERFLLFLTAPSMFRSDDCGMPLRREAVGKPVELVSIDQSVTATNRPGKSIRVNNSPTRTYHNPHQVPKVNSLWPIELM